MVAACAVMVVTACGASSPGDSGNTAAGGEDKKITVVAAENFWGSIAAQLGGDRVTVASIINSPDADPHDYEPTPADGRAIAGARLFIDNGVGYDPWAAKLAAANPVDGRTALTVGDLVGAKDGDNPHRWYNPDDVTKVIDEVTADYKKIDPVDAGYFDQQRASFTATTLKSYTDLIATIKKTYGGTPAGASESIFEMLSPALGLNLMTPQAFLRAISEGADPTAADKATIDDQIKTGKIKVYVYNSQNATPDVQRQVEEAKAAGIPVTTITETPAPASASFQDWQVAQLESLRKALAQATGK
ncbi:periplasmic solute binding protein [Candidatus Protofrankia californiensis]|uniref:Periplasmic solute binding protein n=1 Tax=Candidatus Protofrankia californiensis TaxID=1839754 RepID=A0A1C3PA99_9ACTN|nr:periplasmic solute binding protein [Candidatus Protofrankia californiensis]